MIISDKVIVATTHLVLAELKPNRVCNIVVNEILYGCYGKPPRSIFVAMIVCRSTLLQKSFCDRTYSVETISNVKLNE